jgi:hypothetical protein
MNNNRAARLLEIQQREAKATKGPWKAKPTIGRREVRCDGIIPDYHNHEGDDCYDYDRPDYESCPHTDEIVTTDSGYYGPSMDDAEFIAHARSDVPWLLAKLTATEAERDKLRQLLLDAEDAIRQLVTGKDNG